MIPSQNSQTRSVFILEGGIVECIEFECRPAARRRRSDRLRLMRRRVNDRQERGGGCHLRIQQGL